MNKRKRKKLLVLPLMVIPLLTLGFWVMGGGSIADEPAESSQGLNLQLPDANFKEEKPLDKLGFYAKADKDSIQLNDWMKSDPYYRKEFTALINDTDTESPENKLMQRINQLQNQVNQTSYPAPSVKANRSEERKIEEMIQALNQPAQEDPEIRQLEGTLDKILAIQHPERIKSLQQADETILFVSTKASTDTITDGFFSLVPGKEREDKNAIEAVVHENQMVVNGSVIKLRLLQDIYINNVCIVKGNFIYGVVNLDRERLGVEINSIRNKTNLFTIKLQVYDMDGLAGIYIPGAITRDVAKQSAENSLRLMDMNSVEPSLKAQAAVAGIGAAKNLLSKKVKLVKVHLKAGYHVLLKSK